MTAKKATSSMTSIEFFTLPTPYVSYKHQNENGEAHQREEELWPCA